MQRIMNRGAAFIGLLIVILIMAILYLIDFTAMFGPIDINRAYDERPWF
jgi:Tfp pilus assembly protein PilE